MELVSTQTPTDGSDLLFAVELDDGELFNSAPVVEPVDSEFELGLWLAGLDSFLSLNGHLYAGTANTRGRSDDYTRHFRLTYLALLQCSRLNIALRRAVSRTESPDDHRFSATELDAFSIVLREVLILNESLVKSGIPGNGEWRSWQSTLAEKLGNSPAFAKLTNISGESCVGVLPTRLQDIANGKNASDADLRIILPRFAKTLKTLSVIGRMLRNDEPLKPALLVFANVYEQTRDLVTFMNNRLAKYEDETVELFGLLDGASYTVSMELKKVYEVELKGVIDIRPAPSVYAHTEAAYSLLTESFQQLLSGFARLADPNVSVFELFPNFEEKLNRSLVLRSEMWKVLSAVRAAEKNPERASIDSLRKVLKSFLDHTLQFLFYKDTEVFERFCEEVFAAEEKKDIVPILHRFGAYLETLFGQVNMRSVLANHPFDEGR